MGERKDIINTTGSRLQEILDEGRLTMAAAARKANVSVAVVQKIRDGLNVRRDKFLAVADGLKVLPEDLLPNWK